jgi:2-polyprenyl-3-methyl-5-hydroxy-6-metoxy-1,4-benzoquinol methylase
MQEVFGVYGEYYDTFYSDKDYEKECDFVDEIFKRYSPGPAKTLLDAGCGTGAHAIPLARRGYEVTGFDASGIMIRQAREKGRKAGVSIAFHVLDIRDFSLGKEFDACTSLFAVFGYLAETVDVLAAMARIRHHLKRDSIFTFDFWNGLAVLRDLPSVRVKAVEKDGKRVIRTVQPEMDAFHHLCTSNYHVLVTQGESVIDEFREAHVVRYFFPQEIAHYLDDAGFEVLKLCPFLRLDGTVDEREWNVTAVARVRR